MSGRSGSVILENRRSVKVTGKMHKEGAWQYLFGNQKMFTFIQLSSNGKPLPVSEVTDGRYRYK
jgi:hypothetical protein